ncbi:MAG: O-antigen ligase family protein, partial [Bryobacteraceae bacterium]
MGIRYLIVVATVIGLCILSPIRPVLGLYGYYWFAMMRPDILAWAGPNRYSFLLAAVTLFSNTPRILKNLPLLVVNPVLRGLMLFLLVVTLSVIFAVDPSLCTERYLFFLRVFLMSLVIPLILTTEAELKWFFVVLSGSLGLLAVKYGIYGVLHGGAAFTEGYGGLLSDNNTMALAFAMAVPLCWFSRHLVPWRMARVGFIVVAALALGGVVFTHSRGGILAVGAGLLLITLLEKRKLIALTLLATAGAGVAYLVWDSLSSRMSTLKNPEAEASARSRMILAQSAPKMWLDYPFFGVGFTETNEQRLIFKYVPPEYAVEYSGKVLHNNWLQILVDSGIFAFLIYVWLLFRTTIRCWKQGRRWRKLEDLTRAAIPSAIASSLGAFMVGSTFLSRTTFDLFYILVCTHVAWEVIYGRHQGHAPQPATAGREFAHSEPNLESLEEAQPLRGPTRMIEPFRHGLTRIR